MLANIVILNRLQRKDSSTGMDVWYKKKLNNVEFKRERVSAMSGTQVTMADAYTVLIPFNDSYVRYPEWKQTTNREDYYTISVGDIILFMDDIADEINPNSIASIKQKYAGNVCEVKSINEVQRNGIARFQLKVGGI